MLNTTLDYNQRLQVESMFLKYYREWCLLSNSYIKNMPEAEDMVQDVFVKVLNRRQKNTISDMKNYISTAVRNTCLNKIQRTKKLENVKDYEYMSLLPSHEEFLISEENRHEVLKAVELLPNKSKDVFKLCVLEGAKYQTAADEFGISINTVKFHLKKSFKTLRYELQDTYFAA